MTRIIEVGTSGGAIPEVPGYSGAIRARLADDGTVLEVVPFGTPFKDEVPQPIVVEETPLPPEVQPPDEQSSIQPTDVTMPEQASQAE